MEQSFTITRREVRKSKRGANGRFVKRTLLKTTVNVRGEYRAHKSKFSEFSFKRSAGMTYITGQCYNRFDEHRPRTDDYRGGSV
jgi:hypothetical protein